jgi:hypothetical protein
MQKLFLLVVNRDMRDFQGFQTTWLQDKSPLYAKRGARPDHFLRAVEKNVTPLSSKPKTFVNHPSLE